MMGGWEFILIVAVVLMLAAAKKLPAVVGDMQDRQGGQVYFVLFGLGEFLVSLQSFLR